MKRVIKNLLFKYKGGSMIILSFAISNKKTGKEILRSSGTFESLDSFFHYIKTRYGYSSRNSDFMLSGKEI